MTDQVVLFSGLVATFVAGAAVAWLLLRRAGAGNEAVAAAVRESLKQMEERLQSIEVAREAAHAGLREQVKSLATTELELQKETARLSSAMRSPGVRGRWGELQLKRVVELAGMAEHCDFDEQPAGENDEARKLRPDLVVRLPGDRIVVVDAKTPLTAYLEASESSDEGVRAQKRKDHAAQVRQQVIRLSAKSYWEQFASTPEFAVLFLPGEAFFSAALTEEPQLLEYAAERKVILATPTTLIALLKAVAFGWRQQRAAERSEEIRELGSQLYERMRAMASELTLLGTQLDRAVQSYNRVVQGWETKVTPSAKRMHELGAGGGAPMDDVRRVDAPPRVPR